MAAPSRCRPWVVAHGPAIPTRKETLNPNQQPGESGGEGMHIEHHTKGVNRGKYT